MIGRYLTDIGVPFIKRIKNKRIKAKIKFAKGPANTIAAFCFNDLT